MIDQDQLCELGVLGEMASDEIDRLEAKNAALSDEIARLKAEKAAPQQPVAASSEPLQAYACRVADFKWELCGHDEFHQSLWQMGIGCPVDCAVRLSDGTGIQYFDREPNELLNLVQTAEIFDSATPQPFPAPAVQSSCDVLSADDYKLWAAFLTLREMEIDDVPLPDLIPLIRQAIAQTAPAVQSGGYMFSDADIQMTKFALALLANSPWPTSDTRWQMVEAWLSGLSKLTLNKG